MSGTRIWTTWIPVGAKRVLKDFYWRVYGAFFVNPAIPASPRSFLFVCMGNICRSAFAEASARKYFPDPHGIVAYSAGILVTCPEGSPPEALAAAKTFGVDLSTHRSKRVDEELVAAADMVFAMEAWHFRRLRRTFPRHKEKIFLFAPFEISPLGWRDFYSVLNIQDPYGREMRNFIDCFERINACLTGLFSKIQRLEKQL